MPRVRTPRIYWEATKRRVLTMEWIEGVKLTNKVRLRPRTSGSSTGSGRQPPQLFHGAWHFLQHVHVPAHASQWLEAAQLCCKCTSFLACCCSSASCRPPDSACKPACPPFAPCCLYMSSCLLACWCVALCGSSQAEMDAAGLDIVDFVDVGIEVRLEAVLGSLSSYARPACVCLLPWLLLWTACHGVLQQSVRQGLSWAVCSRADLITWCCVSCSAR